MGKIRFYIALIAAKLAYLAIKLFSKSSGTSFPGVVALKISPNFLSYCPNYVKKKNITITGTNGKTTTSGLVAQMLTESHQRVVHNFIGANMLTGFANAFALNIWPFKRFDYSVMECDEGYLTKLYDFMKADYLIVTNLFADQVDRYGGIETTTAYIKDAISKNPDLKLILNGDDPIVSTFGANNPTVTFGFDRQDYDYVGKAQVYEDYSDLQVTHNGITYDFRVNLQGRYNACNALGAIALAFENGLNQTEIQKAFDNYKTMFGRTEKRLIKGHPTTIQLIKNPAGTNEVLKTVDLDSNIVIAMNNNIADGCDISWFWDAQFELLKGVTKPIVTSGMCANDMAKRLQDAGLPQEKIIIEPSIRKAVEIALQSSDNEKVTIMPSYTALMSLNSEKF